MTNLRAKCMRSTYESLVMNALKNNIGINSVKDPWCKILSVQTSTHGKINNTRLVSQNSEIADIFKEIEEGFKNSGNGKTVDSDEKLFNRASKEMREWTIVVQSIEVQLMFANTKKSSNTLNKKTKDIDNLTSM